jgi:hypothetical protein
MSNRLIKRMLRAAKYAAVNRNGGAEKEKARRLNQMLHEIARAENGVVINHEGAEDATKRLSEAGYLRDDAPAGVHVRDGTNFDPLRQGDAGESA